MFPSIFSLPPHALLAGPARARGYTVVELVIVLVMLGIAASLAAPSLTGYLYRVRMQVALDTLTRDLFYARMVATRAGRRVELHFVHLPEPCVAGYRVVVLEEPVREVKRVDLGLQAPEVCLRMNGPAVLAFSSRGRPSWNHSFWIRHGPLADSVTLNQLGRVYRWH